MNSSSYKAIGLMSGTSLDGLDIACCSFEYKNGTWTFQLHASESVSYNVYWYNSLKEAINYSPDQLDDLDLAYGKWLGQKTKDFIKRNKLKVSLIASHGHTIFHQPAKGITRQIGLGKEIAHITGTKVVYDFRKLDVELGGQGAPLVPIGDEHLFGKYIACLNLGGIANISFKASGNRVAFDIGLANMSLNYLANQLDLPYDDSGKLARRGMIDKAILNKLNQLEYYKRTYPKSLGYEWFLSDILPLIENSEIPVEDKLNTMVEHEVIQIASCFENYVDQPGEILVTGGGALNTYFIERLEYHLPKEFKINIPENSIVEFKEALVFAFMGILSIRDEVNCLKSVTGASRDSCGGVIVNPFT